MIIVLKKIGMLGRPKSGPRSHQRWRVHGESCGSSASRPNREYKLWRSSVARQSPARANPRRPWLRVVFCGVPLPKTTTQYKTLTVGICHPATAHTPSITSLSLSRSLHPVSICDVHDSFRHTDFIDAMATEIQISGENRHGGSNSGVTSFCRYLRGCRSSRSRNLTQRG